MLLGNYNFHFLLTIIINLSVFDDNFIIAVVPHKFLRVLELDLGLLTEEKIIENKVITMPDMDEQKRDDSNKPSKDNGKKNPYDVEDEEDIITVLPPPKNEQKVEIVPITTNFIKEILSFLNFFCVTLIWTFHWVFPFKIIATGFFKINTKEFLSVVLNNTYMNYFIFVVFTFIVFKFVWDHLDEMDDEISDIIDTKGSVFVSMIIFFTNFLLKILFILIVCLYFMASVSSMYKGLNLKLSSKIFKGGLNLSNRYFSKLHIHNSYGLFKTKLPNDRLELELKYLDQNKQWKLIIFQYKPAVTNNNLRFIMPHQPRLDWQIVNSAYSKNVESDPFLIILIGKILERNVIILDLLGYSIPQKENYYKCKHY